MVDQEEKYSEAGQEAIGDHSPRDLGDGSSDPDQKGE
jgi:hypothetical protein